MKKLLLGLCFALVLSGVGPVSSASAREWWWHRHHKENSNSGDAKPHKEKTKKSWFHHHEKAKGQDVAALTNGPRSIGHWHPMPGPAGYGAN